MNTATPEFEYGPIDVFVVEFEGQGISPAVLEALLEASASGTVRLVDLVVVTRGLDGSTRIVELHEEAAGALTGIGFDLEIEGLISENDISAAIADVASGFGVAIAALEMRWATSLASRLAAANGRVVQTERISAPDVNEIIATALAAEVDGV